MVSRSGAELDTEPETDSPRTGRPRDEGREQAILDAAVDLIAEVGYEAMSVESVAARAGVSKATIYRRWSGKTELVAEAMRRMHDDPDADPDDTGSLRGDLLALAQTTFAKMSGVDGGLMCGLAFAVRSDAELGQALDRHKQVYRDRVTDLLISRAKARGEISADTEVPTLMDVAAGVSLLQLMSGKPLDDPFAEYLVDRVLIPLLS
jgi:AcrR family transcriptional regulator